MSREELKNRKRIVIKLGSSSLVHKETGRLNLTKLEVLAREVTDLHNQGKDVVLVKVQDPAGETGLRGDRPGQAHDDLSEILF